MPRIISGDAGTKWRNDTPHVYWQLFTALFRVCASCFAKHGLLSPDPWPTPFHDRCRCYQAVVAPGETGAPFIDYRDIFAKMTEAQHIRAMGGSNFLLIDSGTVKWTDVVLDRYVRPLYEVVAAKRLTIEQMIKIGIAAHIASHAYETAHNSPGDFAARRHGQLAKDLAGAGLTAAQIAAGFETGEHAAPPANHPETPASAIDRTRKATSRILTRLHRGEAGPAPELPDFNGSTAAMKKWILATFPATSALLTNSDWLILILMVEAAEQLKKVLKRLNVDHAKAMKAIEKSRREVEDGR